MELQFTTIIKHQNLLVAGHKYSPDFEAQAEVKWRLRIKLSESEVESIEPLVESIKVSVNDGKKSDFFTTKHYEHYLQLGMCLGKINISFLSVDKESQSATINFG